VHLIKNPVQDAKSAPIVCCHIRFQKAKCVSDRLKAIIKARMKRGSYRVDVEDSPGVSPSLTSKKDCTCLHSLGQEKVMINDKKQTKKGKKIGLSDKIDITSRYLFPISFLVFNICYWFVYVYDIRVLPESARDL